jgi:tRNA (guanosine-2'-O-)-methyltransferase
VKFEAPPGVALQTACTPSGPELCFNATDDNCNGVIDEGCGLSTGALQFIISWGDSPADIDISVTDPSGARVNQDNRATPAGLRLDRDCPSEACHGQNVENVFFDGSDPPRGRYKVDVVVTDLHDAQAPVSVRFGARIGSRSYGADLSLGRGDRKAFTFDL